MRETPLITGEFYHIYNRGVDKRNVFENTYDHTRFLESLSVFNSEDPIGSIFQHRFQNPSLSPPRTKLVHIIAYCLNKNHYHLILEQVADHGIEKFMQKMGAGYTRFFNTKYNRSGALFEGKFKSKHIDTNEYLLYVSAYVNLNFHVHKISPRGSRSSIGEYTGTDKRNLCTKDIILTHFKSGKQYEKEARGIVEAIRTKRYDVADLLLE